MSAADGVADLAEGPAILVVDDDETLLEMLTWWLEHHGYAVTACSTPAAAHAAIGPHVQAIVCDIELGQGVIGTALVAELRRRLDHPIPTVFVSGYRAEFVRINTVDGTDHFLQKPFDLAELAAVLERCVS